MPFDLNGHEDSFPIEQQQMTNWCWAACTLSVCEFYGTANGRSQQSIVAEMLEKPICGNVKSFPPCNKTFDFGDSLKKVGHLSGDAIESSLSPAEVLSTISNGNPIGCQMEIPGIGGHAVLIISAVDDAGEIFLHIADPSEAAVVTTTYSQFRNDYKGLNGRWIRTYLTQPKN